MKEERGHSEVSAAADVYLSLCVSDCVRVSSLCFSSCTSLYKPCNTLAIKSKFQMVRRADRTEMLYISIC